MKQNDKMPAASLPGQVLSWHNRAAWVVLLVALGMVLLALQGLREIQNRAAERQFELHSSELLEAINKRMLDHELILLSAAAIMDVQQQVSREQWARFVAGMRVAENYPGIQGVGFTQIIAPSELADFEQSVRDQGFADFQVRPVGERDRYTAIVFLEPFEGRNLAAFGYDMLSEPVRQQAMLTAAATGEATLTGRVTLMQETHGEVQAGLLMYVPVYRRDAGLTTAEQRLDALRGFAYSPYRVSDLMLGMLGRHPVEVDFAIYAGSEPSEVSLLFRSADQPDVQQSFQARHQLELYGQTWTVDVFYPPDTVSGFSQGHWLVVLMGLLVSLLLFALVTSLSNRRVRVQQLADSMTLELREKELSLRLSEERLGLALKGSNDGWWDLDVPAQSFFASARVWQMIGRSAIEREQSGFDWRQLVMDEDQVRLKQAVVEAWKTEQHYVSIECDLLHADGHAVPVLLRGYILTDAQDQALRISGTCMDLTERRQIERMKNELISVVSHELRTPVTSISGALGLVSAGVLGDLPEAARSMLSIAHQNSLRLTRLINDLLDMDKLMAGKMLLEIRPLPVQLLVQDALAVHQAYAQQFGVNLHAEGLADDGLLADAQRVQQVLSNLLSNAIKFSPKGGQVKLQAQRRGQWIRISVCDHGAGIPAAFHGQIFTKFSQADASSSRQKEGTGLGLVISKELIERMGGQIGFDSVEGQGACFWFELPQCPAPAAETT